MPRLHYMLCLPGGAIQDRAWETFLHCVKDFPGPLEPVWQLNRPPLPFQAVSLGLFLYIYGLGRIHNISHVICCGLIRVLPPVCAYRGQAALRRINPSPPGPKSSPLFRATLASRRKNSINTKGNTLALEIIKTSNAAFGGNDKLDDFGIGNNHAAQKLLRIAVIAALAM